MSARHETHGGDDASDRRLGFALLTVSDTRSSANDESGRVMRELVTSSGHRVAAAAIVPDDAQTVRERILAWAVDPSCDVVVSSGGTGLTARDRTVDAVSGLFELTLDGFGELFRVLSFEQIGSRAMLSRAAAGTVRGTPVFLLPGSPHAVTLALSRLILPEITHLVGELRRHG